MELEFHQIAKRYAELRISMPGYEGRLMASLASEGQLHPVLVVKNPGEGAGYVLIDGYRRVRALEGLGRDTVEAVVLPLEEPAALMFRHCQQRSQPRSALEDGWLLRELLDQHGLSQAELSRRLHRSESWVSRRLSLVRELPDSVQELVRRGRVCSDAASKYLVPLSRGKRSDCEELARNLSGKRTSTREVERIYEAWKRGDSEQRLRIVQRPFLYLRSADEVMREPDEGAGDPYRTVSEDMSILDAVSGRARRRVGELGTSVVLPDPVVESWRTARSSFTALAEVMEKRAHAGPRDQGGGAAPLG